MYTTRTPTRSLCAFIQTVVTLTPDPFVPSSRFFITNAAHQALIDALQQSKDELDQVESNAQGQDGNVVVDVGAGHVDKNGFYVTHDEHNGLIGALNTAREALDQNARTLREESYAEQQRQTDTFNQEMAALHAKIRELQDKLMAAAAEGVSDKNTIAKLNQQIEVVKNELENLKRDVGKNGVLSDAETDKLRLDLTHALMRAEKAEAREAMCQAELDHLRQRKEVGASETFKKLQDENNRLHRELEELLEMGPAVGPAEPLKTNSNAPDGLTHALLSEIAALQNEARDHTCKCPPQPQPQPQPRHPSRDTGVKQKIYVNANTKRRAKKSKSKKPHTFRRVVHAPIGTASTVSASTSHYLTQPSPPTRVNFWVKVTRTAASIEHGKHAAGVVRHVAVRLHKDTRANLQSPCTPINLVLF